MSRTPEGDVKQRVCLRRLNWVRSRRRQPAHGADYFFPIMAAKTRSGTPARLSSRRVSVRLSKCASVVVIFAKITASSRPAFTMLRMDSFVRTSAAPGVGRTDGVTVGAVAVATGAATVGEVPEERTRNEYGATEEEVPTFGAATATRTL
jgi:hypothetical protein